MQDNRGGENRLDVLAKTFSKVTEGLCDVIFDINTIPWILAWVCSERHGTLNVI